MAGYLDASGLKHFKRKNDATYLGKQEKAASAKVADSVVWENVSGRPDLSALIPPGTIIHYAGRTVPSGWLICNGANVSRTDYAALFAAIGTIYGAGNGSTTFGLPNLNGRFFEGTTYTGSVGTYHSAGLPNITGQLNKSPTPWSGLLYEQNGALKPVNVGDTAYSGHTNGSNYRLEFDASRSNEIYGNSTTVQPPSMALLPCIKF
ncbi:phage tail protein [Sutterella wadsworthensis]|uniref:phage tail protein n=1 Tax=Sutterella wadsworthensis TaxID=40545 RepID=UPI003AF5331A